MNIYNVSGSSKAEKEEHPTTNPRARNVPDLYHLSHIEERDSQLLCTNVADVSLISSHSEVRKGEVNILTRSHTLNISCLLTRYCETRNKFFTKDLLHKTNLFCVVKVGSDTDRHSSPSSQVSSHSWVRLREQLELEPHSLHSVH